MDLSSIIELREELGKKEYQIKKSNRERGQNTLKRKDNLGEKVLEHDDILEKSRLRLMEKSKIYDQLTHGNLSLRETDLVDFDRQYNNDKTFSSSTFSSKMIEIKDEFGRTRLISQEQENDIAKFTNINDDSKLSSPLDQQVFYDPSKEIRNKGIGFIDLGKDWKIRENRLEALKKSRMETLDNRQKNEILKEEKRLLKEKRLSIIADKLKKKREIFPEYRHCND